MNLHSMTHTTFPGMPGTSRGVNQTSIDLTKFVKDHFKAPPSKPYQCKKIWTKTKKVMINERSEKLWEEHYIRRMGNMKKGYQSVPWEPYKLVGDELFLNTKDLVLHSMSECLDQKVHSAVCKGDEQFKFEKRNITLPPIGAASNKVTSQSPSCTSTSVEFDAEESGYCNVKKHLIEYDQVIKNVQAGQPYEEYIRNRQELQRKSSSESESDNDMVLMSLTNLQLGLPDVKFMEEEDSDSDTSEIVTQEKIPQEKPPPKKQRFSMALREPTSPEELCQMLPARGRRISVVVNNRKMTLKDDMEWSNDSGLNASTIEGLNKLMNVHSGITEKKNRLRRDHLEFLEGLLIILNTLYNIKSKDLKSKTPLKIETMKVLRKEPHTKPEKPTEGHLRWQSRTKQIGSVMKVGSILAEESGYSGGMANMVSMASQLKRRSIWPGRQKVGYDQQPVETWEDLINLESSSKKAEKFHMQSKIVLKALIWSRRKALINTLQTDSKSSVATAVPDSTVNLPTSQYGIRRELMGTESHRQQYHTSHIRKMPIWQMVALDKPIKVEEKRRTIGRTDPLNIVKENRKALNKIKQDRQQDVEMEFQKQDREKMALFKLKYKAFQNMSPLFEEHIIKMRQPIGIHSQSVDLSSDVQPSKWYDELQTKTYNITGMYDDQVNEVLKKLGRYSTMDNKSVQFFKAKLCLIIMSLPAYEILKISMQKALKYTMEMIVLGEGKQLEEWFKHRKIPYFVLDETLKKD